MTGRRGPVSKDPTKRARRNAPRAATKIAATSGGYPPLEGEFSDATRGWYEALASSWWASMYEASDWQVLIRTAYLVEAFYDAPSAGLAAEIRQNEARLGATAADRARLGWEAATGPGAKGDGNDEERVPARERSDPRKAKS